MANIIYAQHTDGRFTQVNRPSRPDRANFVIVCPHGDWSGYRTLEECEKQFPELTRYFQESQGRRNFVVEER